MMAEMWGAASMSQQYWRQLGAVINIVQFSSSFLSFFCGDKYSAIFFFSSFFVVINIVQFSFFSKCAVIFIL